MTAEPVRSATVNGATLSYVEAGRGNSTPSSACTAAWMITARGAPNWALSPHITAAIAYSRALPLPEPLGRRRQRLLRRAHAEDSAGLIRTVTDPPVHLLTSSYGGNVALS